MPGGLPTTVRVRPGSRLRETMRIATPRGGGYPTVRQSVAGMGFTAAMGPARAAVRRSPLTAARFTGALLAVCLLAQRFAIPVGSRELSVAAPVGLLLAAWGVGVRTLVIDRRRAACFLGICAMAMIATAVHANLPVSIAPRVSLFSLVYWLAITGFAMLRFREAMAEDRFFDIISTWLMVVAAAGVLAFIGQFVGLSLFTFSHLVPARWLIERQYAVVIPLPGTGILRANGFFLVEPSVFSQFMAIGIIVEWLTFRRLWRMLLFLGGLLAAVAGTGWLLLAAFLARSALTVSTRGMLRALALIVVCAAAVTAASVLLPTITASLFDRMHELSQPGSSGYARFVTPFMALRRVLHDAPWSVVTGLGPGASQALLLPFKYQLNTPIKILMEYGGFGLLSYAGILLLARRSAGQSALLVPLLVLLMFTGGYQEFPPILFPVVLMTTVALLRPAASLPGVAAPVTTDRSRAPPGDHGKNAAFSLSLRRELGLYRASETWAGRQDGRTCSVARGSGAALFLNAPACRRADAPECSGRGGRGGPLGRARGWLCRARLCADDRCSLSRGIPPGQTSVLGDRCRRRLRGAATPAVGDAPAQALSQRVLKFVLCLRVSPPTARLPVSGWTPW